MMMTGRIRGSSGTIRTLGVLFMALAAVQPAAAQRIDSPYRFLDFGQQVGLLAGYVDASPGRIGAGPQPGPVVGGRWGLRIGGPFAVGAEVTYMPTTRMIRDTAYNAALEEFEVLGEANVGLMNVHGVLTFTPMGPRTWHGIRPLASLGAGAAFNVRGRDPEEEELPGNVRYRFGTSFAGHFGGGVEWFPTARVSIRGDARNSLWRVGIPEAFGLTQVGAALPRSQWESNLTFMAGASFHF
jgi:hypothetical protein